ncbi:hypothetical protein GF324_03730 [bacterium]|nr:hypothetical protein [bacterium]
MIKLLVLLSGMVLLALPVQAGNYNLGSTGFEFSGDLTITFVEMDKQSEINENLRGDDPFNLARARLFFGKEFHEHIRMDLELLWDDGADPRIQGAYFTFSDLLTSGLDAKVGLIPHPFGNYGHRSTYFNQNPLIGVPAMWHYITPLSSRGDQAATELIGNRAVENDGIPMGYDTCWDTGISLHYEQGWFEGATAITQATLSSPYAKRNDGYQGTVKLGLHPTYGLRFGGSAAYGPWIARRDDMDLPDAIESYMQTALGAYAEYSFGRWQFFSEWMQLRWEMPFIEEGDVSAWSAYGEAKWKVTPSYYLAARYDRFQYGEIDNGNGVEREWGYSFNRLETALAWRVIREGFIRLDYQGTFFDHSEIDPVHLIALQFEFSF